MKGETEQIRKCSTAARTEEGERETRKEERKD